MIYLHIPSIHSLLITWVWVYRLNIAAHARPFPQPYPGRCSKPKLNPSILYVVGVPPLSWTHTERNHDETEPHQQMQTPPHPILRSLYVWALSPLWRKLICSLYQSLCFTVATAHHHQRAAERKPSSRAMAPGSAASCVPNYSCAPSERDIDYHTVPSEDGSWHDSQCLPLWNHFSV